MTKILIVAGNMDVGGIENQLMHLIRNADSSHFKFDYTTTLAQPYYQNEIEELGGQCIYISGTDGGKHIVRYCLDLLIIMKKGQYDVVHSHELFHSGIVLWIAKIAGVKCRIAHAHSCNQGQDSSIKRRLYHKIMRKSILNNATDLLACSSMASEFLYGSSSLNDSRLQVIVNSVETNRFLSELPASENNEFRKNGWNNVIQIGRFADEKNYLFTIEIAKEIKKRGLKIRFLFIGNNGEEYENKVRMKVEEYELGEYVVLLGIRSDIDVLMKKAEVFILPSKYEGMPLTLIEAQTAGLQCVVADNFSHEVDFDIGSVQWLKLDDDIDIWINAILRAIQNGKSEKRLVKNAIDIKGFDAHVFSEKMCEIYRNRVNEN